MGYETPRFAETTLNETQPWKEPHKKDQEVARPFWIHNIHNIWRLPLSSACVFSDVTSGRILDYSKNHKDLESGWFQASRPLKNPE